MSSQFVRSKTLIPDRGVSMNAIFHDTEDAVFQFQASDVIQHLKNPLNGFDDETAAKLLEMICTDSEESIEIPEEQELFGYVALDLLAQGKGAVSCKACNKTYDAGQLKSVRVGAGNGPLHVKVKPERGIRNLFRRGKRRNPSMAGGQGFDCPKVTL
jgi:hypothetical protein